MSGHPITRRTYKQTQAERQAAISDGVKATRTAPRKSKPPKLPPIKETLLVKQILMGLELATRGWASWWRNNTGAMKSEGGHFVHFGSPGSPDILGIMAPYGRLVGIEVKRPGGKVTRLQEDWQREAREYGALVGVVHSIEEALALLKSGVVK